MNNPTANHIGGKTIDAAIALMLCTGVLESRAQPNWPQFRGPNCQGLSQTARPPIEFSSLTNMAWSTAIPSGHSSPVIWGKRIFLTAYEAGALETHAYDRSAGRQLWKQPTPAERIEKVQPFNSPASSTPVVSSDKVFVNFGSYGVLCYTHEGNELWRKPLPPLKNQYGTASSPLLCGDRLVLILDSDDRRSSLVALRTGDGEVAWQADHASRRAPEKTKSACFRCEESSLSSWRCAG